MKMSGIMALAAHDPQAASTCLHIINIIVNIMILILIIL